MKSARARLVHGVLVATGALTATGAGRAEPPPARGGYYGWQILVAHGVCLGTAAGFGALPESRAQRVAIPIALGAASLTGPVVHMAHGYVDKTFFSFGLQIGTIFGGFVVAESLACSERCSKAQSLTAGYLGLGLGSLVGVVVDAVLIGWDRPLRAVSRPSLIPSTSHAANL